MPMRSMRPEIDVSMPCNRRPTSHERVKGAEAPVVLGEVLRCVSSPALEGSDVVGEFEQTEAGCSGAPSDREGRALTK